MSRNAGPKGAAGAFTLSADIQGLITPELRLAQAVRDLLGKISLRVCI